jgi:hypothetical protein
VVPRQAAEPPHLRHDAGFVLRSSGRAGGRMMQRPDSDPGDRASADRVRIEPCVAGAPLACALLCLRPSPGDACAGSARFRRIRRTGWVPPAGSPSTAPSEDARCRSPRLHRPWRAIGFKAFLRRRVRSIPGRFRPWDALSFHGLWSPSRFALASPSDAARAFAWVLARPFAPPRPEGLEDVSGRRARSATVRAARSLG